MYVRDRICSNIRHISSTFLRLRNLSAPKLVARALRHHRAEAVGWWGFSSADLAPFCHILQIAEQMVVITERLGTPDDFVESVRRRMFEVSVHTAKSTLAKKHRNGPLDV